MILTTCVIVLKSGKEIRIKCDEFTVKSNNNGFLSELKFINPSENELQYVNCTDVAAVYQIKASGKEGEADG